MDDDFGVDHWVGGGVDRGQVRVRGGGEEGRGQRDEGFWCSIVRGVRRGEVGVV